MVISEVIENVSADILDIPVVLRTLENTSAETCRDVGFFELPRVSGEADEVTAAVFEEQRPSSERVLLAAAPSEDVLAPLGRQPTGEQKRIDQDDATYQSHCYGCTHVLKCSKFKHARTHAYPPPPHTHMHRTQKYLKKTAQFMREDYDFCLKFPRHASRGRNTLSTPTAEEIPFKKTPKT